MTRKNFINQAGVTVVELSLVLVVFGVGIVGSMTVLDEGSHFVNHSISRLRTDESNRLAMTRIVDLINESSMKHMDTSSRLHLGGIFNVESDRFQYSDMAFSQCVSPVCRFHTEGGAVTNAGGYDCGHEYRNGFGFTSVVRGKVWPGTMAVCPLDGFPTTELVTQDMLKYFSARDVQGQFNTDGGTGPEPDWNSLVILAPYADDREGGQLRRYLVQVSDLLAGTVTSSGTSPFDANTPDMVALFDFGADGTTDGVPDGSVPLSAGQSDGNQELFLMGTSGGEPAIIYTKTLGSPGIYPWRTADLTIRLRDGFTYFSIRHQESSSVHWTATRLLTRTPEVLVNNLTEFAVSTQVSNPYNAATNAQGVNDPGVVRVTIGTTDRVKRNGVSEWNHDVKTLVLKPRN